MELLPPARTPVRALGSALFDIGLHVREEYDELVLIQRFFVLRIHATGELGGSSIHCQVSVAELGLVPGSLGLFGEMATEGFPVVAVGACGGRISCEFNWFHPGSVDWRITADRCQGLVDRVVGECASISDSKPLRTGVRRVVPFRRVA
jgi:hypothetical protein